MAVVFSLLALLSLACPMYSQDADRLPAQEFADRRLAVLEHMPDSSVAIFRSAVEKIRSKDVTFEFRQNNNFYYLTGIPDPKCILVLMKPGVELEREFVAEIVFVPKRSLMMATWLGKSVSVNEAKNVYGFRTVLSTVTFKDTLATLLMEKKRLLYDFPTHSAWDIFSAQPASQQTAKQLFGEAFPDLKIESPSAILARLRQVKSPAEIRLLRKAIEITSEAHKEAMRRVRPGMYEYQIEAIIEYVFKLYGAESPAFPSIIGSGPNSTILHYWKNRRKTKDHDLVVIDIGAEYHGYSADVTRTIPMSGIFSEQQREIYEIVLRAQKEALETVKPGVTLSEIHKVAKGVISAAGYGKYFIHGTSHYLGLDTHDVGIRGSVLAPGMVLTVEPGIYIREGADIDTSYWNIGVRIEDDVLVTAEGYELLSKSSPREIEDIEALMKETRSLSLPLPK
ncbi:MAG: aminopeptidase P N-terminal domain-containing protein [bacterium]